MTKLTNQHDDWAGGKVADEYFVRNRHKLDASKPPAASTRFIASHVLPSDRILEIGTANGRTLEQIRLLSGCRAVGVDPSPLAIADGRSRHEQLDLQVASADRLPFASSEFDVVVLGFFLYLVDRARLFAVVSEVDRVLRPGAGRLVVTDFDPPTPTRRQFEHSPGHLSFKQNYPQLWLANPQYVLTAKMSYSHQTDTFHSDPGERVCSVVLTKQDVEVAYPEVSR